MNKKKQLKRARSRVRKLLTQCFDLQAIVVQCMNGMGLPDGFNQTDLPGAVSEMKKSLEEEKAKREVADQQRGLLWYENERLAGLIRSAHAEALVVTESRRKKRKIKVVGPAPDTAGAS